MTGAGKERLDALSKRAKAFESEQWQLEEIRKGIAELDAGQGVSHKRTSEWLNSWGRR